MESDPFTFSFPGDNPRMAYNTELIQLKPSRIDNESLDNYSYEFEIPTRSTSILLLGNGLGGLKLKYKIQRKLASGVLEDLAEADRARIQFKYGGLQNLIAECQLYKNRVPVNKEFVSDQILKSLMFAADFAFVSKDQRKEISPSPLCHNLYGSYDSQVWFLNSQDDLYKNKFKENFLSDDDEVTLLPLVWPFLGTSVNSCTSLPLLRLSDHERLHLVTRLHAPETNCLYSSKGNELDNYVWSIQEASFTIPIPIKDAALLSVTSSNLPPLFSKSKLEAASG